MDCSSHQPLQEGTTWSEEDRDRIQALVSKFDEPTLHNAISQFFMNMNRMYHFLASICGLAGRLLISTDRMSSSSWSSSCPTIAGSFVDSSRSLAPSVDTTISLAPTLVPPNPQLSTSSSKSTQGVFYCPYQQYHEDLGKPPPYFHKKGDCKVHMKNFHNLEYEWPCTRCYKKFDRESDFLKHFGRAHPGHKPGKLTDIVTRLLPKQVFACGFQDCENLSQSWEPWFNHITSHMNDGMTIAQWNDSVVISNLLRQNVLRQSWENLLYRIHGPSRPSLVWQPPNARVLCQKLECQDFRPGIQFLVQAAYRLALFGSTPIDSLPGQYLQIGLGTPTCDSVPEFKDNDHLDRILMRNRPDTLSPVSNPPSLDYLTDTGQRQPNLDSVPFGFMTEQSMSIIHPSGQMQIFNGVTLPSYTPEQTPFPDFSGFGLDQSGPGLSRTVFPDTHDQMDVESPHPLQQLNYFDWDGFVKENSQSPHTPGRLLRRAKSSMSLSSKKLRPSPEVDPVSLPLVPPMPPTETDQSGRPRPSSQRSRLIRKSQHPHSV